MASDLAEKVLSVIASVKRIPREKVTIGSTFEELGLDSLDAMNILFELESEFDISIPDNEARSIKTVQGIVDGVERLVAAKNQSPATA